MNKPKTALYPYPVDLDETILDTILEVMPENIFGPVRAIVLLNLFERTEEQQKEMLEIFAAHLGSLPPKTDSDSVAGWMLRLSNKDGYESVKHWFAIANCHITAHLLTHTNAVDFAKLNERQLESNDNAASNSPASVTFRVMREQSKAA